MRYVCLKFVYVNEGETLLFSGAEVQTKLVKFIPTVMFYRIFYLSE